jgi:hypothetical protein
MALLFDHLVGAQKERFGDSQAERFGSRYIDDQIELGRLLDWDVGWLRSAQNLVDNLSGSPKLIWVVRGIRHQT